LYKVQKLHVTNGCFVNSEFYARELETTLPSHLY